MRGQVKTLGTLLHNKPERMELLVQHRNDTIRGIETSSSSEDLNASAASKQEPHVCCQTIQPCLGRATLNYNVLVVIKNTS